MNEYDISGVKYTLTLHTYVHGVQSLISSIYVPRQVTCVLGLNVKVQVRTCTCKGHRAHDGVILTAVTDVSCVSSAISGDEDGGEEWLIKWLL